MFKFIKLELLILEFVNQDVDLVMERALKPSIRQRMLEQVVYV